jgi:hypothetical protein
MFTKPGTRLNPVIIALKTYYHKRELLNLQKIYLYNPHWLFKQDLFKLSEIVRQKINKKIIWA